MRDIIFNDMREKERILRKLFVNNFIGKDSENVDDGILSDEAPDFGDEDGVFEFENIMHDDEIDIEI